MEAKVTDLQATIPAAEYLKNYRNQARFFALCKECVNFGALWACPPFERDWTGELERYDLVTIFVTKIEPGRTDLSPDEVRELFRRERRRIEPRLRELEAQTCGTAFAFAGECLYCPEAGCTRLQGQPCRHPELVRPSLEGVGFDIGKTTESLFSLPLLWASPSGSTPSYYLLTTAIFHNALAL